MEKDREIGAKLNGDLLCKLMDGRLASNGGESQEEEDEEIELSLGLSLNGRFGVDPQRKRLKRSSSVSNMVFSDNGTAQHARVVAYESHMPSLGRACSLPTESAEEVLRRKELQWMRRMEARKKRMEKSKNLRVVKERNFFDSDNGDGLNGTEDEIVNSRIVNNESCNGFQAVKGLPFPSPQGSLGSFASASSGISETHSRHKYGTKQNAEAGSPSSIQSVPVTQVEQKPVVKSVIKNPNGAKEKLKNTKHDMPYVSTKGNGKNGSRVDGFLYRYRKGEEVRIVCVCHGLFLSPADFVKHGGGGDVENPLKHIVVNPSPLM